MQGFLRFTATNVKILDFQIRCYTGICMYEKENLIVFHILFTKLQTVAYFARFLPKRAPKCAFSYCFVDAVPPSSLRRGDFGAWTRVFWIWNAGVDILHWGPNWGTQWYPLTPIFPYFLVSKIPKSAFLKEGKCWKIRRRDVLPKKLYRERAVRK